MILGKAKEFISNHQQAIKDNKDLIQKIDKQKPSEWVTIHNYLLYKWKEKKIL
ncbi:MAG: hypothetical protein I3273_03225 [Candidatus Moeniiplasma glomeromycotorum]|nr:hypothetical protein [Candidatus Moeniiplasma glomeromycotorum]MCE8167713.1 hypothetical protein [Candidatus Moeniiplasma glomeromycotorum]MCE8169113.1 hypothetical protein [Candidatus Moeniiplasma glomeromycotorum]